MALLDLQAMESPAPQGRHSRGCGCPSNLSVTLCNDGSGLSVLLCA